MTVSDIITLLGGTSKVARHNGWPISTVDSWVRINQVPDWRRGALLAMALEKGVALSTADFPPPEDRVAA